MNYPRIEKQALSFHGEPLLRGRHRIHPYPAMLHPLLVDCLIETYGEEGDVIFDPFCGSGVTLLQSAIKGYVSIGFDINPIGLLISRAKTQSYQKQRLLKEFQDFKDSLDSVSRFDDDFSDIPVIKNRDYWYSEEVVRDLGRVRRILRDGAYEYRDFFLTNFAFVCRNQSLTRKGEFKRYRMQKEKITNVKNEVFLKFLSQVTEMIGVFLKEDIPRKRSRAILANAQDKIPIPYDLVITSPPYGDSRTTVAYGQYTSFGAEWVKDLTIYSEKLEKESLGVEKAIDKDLAQQGLLMDTIEKIKEVDSKRASDVLYFFNGYYIAVKNIVENLNEKGRVCFIVGNRTVKGFEIPMDQITASFLDSLGLRFEGIFVRDIVNKVMPSKNSPTNKVGEKSRTMSNEYIVVFRKG